MASEEHFELAAETIEGNISWYKQKPHLRDRIAWQVAQTIFQIHNPSGKISVKADRALRSGEITRYNLCAEHHFPRMKAARKILSYFQNQQVDMTQLMSMIKTMSETHYVLQEENKALKRLNDSPGPLRDADSMVQYSHLGIDLIDFNYDSRKKYVYKIDGIVYSIKEIMAKYNVTAITINNRCLHDMRNKFPNWTREEIR
jgi:hypothetical protein